MTSREVRRSAAPDSGFGVYVHWPFCAQKCPYCDFNSHVRHGGWDEARFLSAYLTELDTIAAWMRDDEPKAARTVSSIFFGGGTPSLMQPDTVGAILDHAAKLWPVAGDAEITLEANPGSVEAARFAGYKSAGVNRVSVGLQSLRDAQLQEARDAFTRSRRPKGRLRLRDVHLTGCRSISSMRGRDRPPANWRDELGRSSSARRRTCFALSADD